MELYSRVRIKVTGKTGTVLEKGSPFGELLYLVQLDDIAEFENTDDGLLTCRENELEPIV